MKTKELKYTLAGRTQVFVVSLLALLRKRGIGGEETSGAVPASVLESLKIQLVSPNVTGAQVLTTKQIRPCHYSVSGNTLTITLAHLAYGTHRLTVNATYGTNTLSLLVIDATVPVGAGETGNAINVDVAAVSNMENENNVSQEEFNALELVVAGKADGSIYRVGESGDPAQQDVAKIFAHSVELSREVVATGYSAVAEGESTTASGYAAHSEGECTTASGNYAHSEGEDTTASGYAAHSEGENTTASGYAAHSEGENTTASGDYAHSEGGSMSWENPFELHIRPLTAAEKQLIADRFGNDMGLQYVCEDDEIDDYRAPVLYNDEECTDKVAEVKFSRYIDFSDYGVALPSGDYFAIKEGTLVEGDYWGRFEPAASGYAAHSEGNTTTASGDAAHSEGDNTTASGNAAHSEGYYTTASGYYAHSEGNTTTASGYAAHSEGEYTTASGNYAHSEGYTTTASGYAAHSEGEKTTAAGAYQHVIGAYNVEDAGAQPYQKGEYAFIIGNGDDDDHRHNALAVTWDGKLVMWNGATKLELTPAKLQALLALV